MVKEMDDWIHSHIELTGEKGLFRHVHKSKNAGQVSTVMHTQSYIHTKEFCKPGSTLGYICQWADFRLTSHTLQLRTSTSIYLDIQVMS